MTNARSEIFENATQIAEERIRSARAMQADVTKDIVKGICKFIAKKFARGSHLKIWRKAMTKPTAT